MANYMVTRTFSSMSRCPMQTLRHGVMSYSTKGTLSTMELIKKLREEMQAPLNIVKLAATQASPPGDYGSALAFLKKEMIKRGEKLVAKSAERKATEGWVIAARTADGSHASLSVMNCETDFVAKSERVVELAKTLGEGLASSAAVVHPGSTLTPAPQEVIDQVDIDGRPLKELLVESMSVIGESMKLSRAVLASRDLNSGSILGIHCHGGPSISKDVFLGRMGAMINVTSSSRDATGIADELAREIVAQNPDSLEEFWTLEKSGIAKVEQFANGQARV